MEEPFHFQKPYLRHTSVSILPHVPIGEECQIEKSQPVFSVPSQPRRIQQLHLQRKKFHQPSSWRCFQPMWITSPPPPSRSMAARPGRWLPHKGERPWGHPLESQRQKFECFGGKFSVLRQQLTLWTSFRKFLFFSNSGRFLASLSHGVKYSGRLSWNTKTLRLWQMNADSHWLLVGIAIQHSSKAANWNYEMQSWWVGGAVLSVGVQQSTVGLIRNTCEEKWKVHFNENLPKDPPAQNHTFPTHESAQELLQPCPCFWTRIKIYF